MSMRIKQGDIFLVRLYNGIIRYFQFIGKDISELNGDVIAIFKRHYINEETAQESIVSDEIECYMHTSVLAGVKLRLWKRVFHSGLQLNKKVFFRTSLDVGLYPRQRFVSHNWVVWEMGGQRRYYGTLPEEYYSADIGGIYAPIHVISRLESEKDFDKYYPLYELLSTKASCK